MNGDRHFKCYLAAVIAAWSLTASLSAQDDAAKPEMFHDLLQMGAPVYWSNSNLQLLTAEQVKAIEQENREIGQENKEIDKEHAEIEKKLNEIARIKQTLTMEQDLEKRAKLLLTIEKLEAELPTSVRSRKATVTFYRVSYVGNDYVALRHDDRETYVPFRSIETMYRGGQTPSNKRTTSDLGRDLAFRRRGSGRGGFGGGFSFGRGGFGGRGGTIGSGVRLSRLEPAKVAEVINKLFAKQNVNVTADPTQPGVRIDAEDRATLSSVLWLIQQLDAEQP